MAIHRGIQSALFYYLSCAPCTEARTRRKRRKEADLLRAEKDALAASSDAQGLKQYEHPLPSTTNPAWDIEIAIGPSKESKQAARNNKARAKETPPRSSGSTSKSNRKEDKSRSTPDLSLDQRVQWAESFQRNLRHDSPAMPQKAKTFPQDRSRSGLSPLSESQDERPSPRDSPPHTPSDFSTSASINIQRPPPTKLASTSLNGPAWPYQPHPPINDHHPATVTKYDSPSDIAWMLAPPPNAKVMRGHEPERPHHLSPRKRTPTMSSRQSRPAERPSPANADAPVRSADVSPHDMRGLGIGYESEEDLDAVEGAAMEKRDSAGPQPGRDDGGKYLFPPRDWGAQEARRDSGSEEGFSEKQERLHYRWSIDMGEAYSRALRGREVDV
ncbi:hypothetical protein C1H76_7810 [Elsinoe australis]|uniref:Uncharacterized protein n=1 Tax=Elsinoe australis TaxID=40998 RepID=A0A4U7ATX1_9PEZI|nr:hypothetical protein C1H76_7810 [Elsinoe australis]